MTFKNVDRPVLILDEERCKQNIQRIVSKSELNDCEFRPHFKTHQSKTIGRWFKEAGVNGITVSSPEMGLYFAGDGWDDITIAFPFYPAQIEKLKELEKYCKLRLFITSKADIKLLNQELKNPFLIIIEIDSGYGRSGIHFKNNDIIKDLIKTSNRLKLSKFHGFYIHDGRTYRAIGKEEIEAAVQPSIHALLHLKEKFSDAKISLGDTPSASVLTNLGKLDEITPGNLVFYDWMQVQIGSCSVNDVCLYVLLPIAQYKEDGKNVIVHGGAAHLSKEFILTENIQNFGQVIQYSKSSHIRPEKDSRIIALSQEHGTLNKLSDKSKDYITIIPIHSCLTANLFDHYITTDGKRIDKRVLS